MLEIIKQAKNNNKEIEVIKNKLQKREEIKNNKVTHIKYDVYDKKIKALEQERNKEVSKIEKEFDKEEVIKDKKIEELYKPITKVKRIFQFLQIQDNYKELVEGGYSLEIKKNSVEQYDRHNKDYLECLDYLFNDDLLKIRLFIAENDKPKNKYSLIAYGKTIFYGDKIITFPYSYGGVHINKKEHFRIDITLKDSYDVETLKLYVLRNKDRILQEFIEQYQEVKKEYLETIKKYSLKDFKEFEIFKEHRELSNEQQTNLRKEYLKSENKKEWEWNTDRDKEENYYEKNKKKFNFKTYKIMGESF